MRDEKHIFEEGFKTFLDSEMHEQWEAESYALLRLAFQAGWEAAGGKPMGFLEEWSNNT